MTDRAFIIFGASGDLAGRYLLPAFAQLIQTDKLPMPVTILGVSPQRWSPEDFRRHAAEQLRRHSEADHASRERLVSCLDYRAGDVTDAGQVAGIVRAVPSPIIVYLALPSALFEPAITALGPSLKDGARIVVEKPFGEDLESAQRLNRLLHDTLPESAVFRMDHFLGMRTVQNILGLRFANRLFEPLWSHQHVERVELIWDETLALEGRASYYDRAGALRDMVQNHLLQLLCLVAMEPPVGLDEQDLRNRKVDVLRAVRRMSPDDVDRRTVRARYSAGRIGARSIPAYIDERGIDRARHTETYVDLTLHIDNWRWAGVPFSLRSGKALARDRQEVAVQFKPVPHLAFGLERSVEPNRLRIHLNPDRLDLHVNVTGADELLCLHEIALEKDLAQQSIPAYGQLLLDVIQGQHTLSIRDDEAEESWRIVQPILDAWAKGRSPLRDYAAGSEGPG